MKYIPSPTGELFHDARDVDTGFVRMLLGPIGSGKSVTCAIELLLIAMDQEPDENGIRRTKFAIIRNTYRELLDTTVETFFAWIPQECGYWSSLNMSFELSQELEDGTTMETEFLFRALDKPDDIKKLLSLEITAAWINEGKQIGKPIFDMVQGRVGRYPPKMMGVDPTFFGVIVDSNMPDKDHWIFKVFEEGIPDNYKLFKQPSGLSPLAENTENLPRNYYKNLMSGKQKEWINVYIHAKYGFVTDDKPVWPEYRDDIHWSDEIYVPDPRLTLYVGVDFGLTPAAPIGQLTSSGRMIIFDELVTEDMGAKTFGRLLKEKLNTQYSQFKDIQVYGDPAGEGRVQTDEMTPYMILANEGINAFPTYTNDFTIRREAVADLMTRLDFVGKPALLICGKAYMTRKACGGGYRYKRLQVSGEERYHDVPDKGKYSHVGDGLQYLVLGAVGGNRVIGGYSNTVPDYSLSIRGIV